MVPPDGGEPAPGAAGRGVAGVPAAGRDAAGAVNAFFAASYSTPQIGCVRAAGSSAKLGSSFNASVNCWRQSVRRPSTHWLNATYL